MTTSTLTPIPTVAPSRQVRRALSRKTQPAGSGSAPQAQNHELTERILDAAALKAAAAAQAATLAQAKLAQVEVQAWLKDMDERLEVIFAHPEQNLGEIEEQLARSIKEPLRLLAQRAAQVKANAVPSQCPKCHRPLEQQRTLSRTISSRFGPLTIWRRYGWCSHCAEWHFPADHALGLGRKATEEQGQLANRPVGSGAIESACRQYQCRFKRTGQFWTTAGDEALLCLETLWRNGRWHELYPHARSSMSLN